MPKQSPSPVYYARATKATTHGSPVIEDGVPGVAVKQKATSWGAGITGLKNIAINEDFLILVKGEVQVPAIGGATKGAPVYITPATNALTLTAAAGLVPYGRVVELAGQRGTPTGKMKVDLDLRNNVNTP